MKNNAKYMQKSIPYMQVWDITGLTFPALACSFQQHDKDNNSFNDNNSDNNNDNEEFLQKYIIQKLTSS